MGAFEFLFTLFSLLLGFSIAEIAGGFARAYSNRKTQPVEWLAPLLAVLLIMDILSFWYGAWFRRDIELKFWVVLVVAVIGLLYYFAATQVFPKDGSAVSPTDHVMANRKAIVLAVMAADLIMFLPSNIAQIQATHGGRLLELQFWINPAYFALMAAIGWLPGKRWVIAAIVVLIAALSGVFLATNY